MLIIRITNMSLISPFNAEQVIWNRERVSAAQDGIVNEISGADLFIFAYPGAPALKYANQMYIDTGAVFCGRLTLVQVQGGDHA
jgi:serine/threonine protein phosphatase 1